MRSKLIAHRHENTYMYLRRTRKKKNKEHARKNKEHARKNKETI